MAQIFQGRYSATSAEPFVVFMIWMRINKIWAVRQWWPVARAMVPMLTTLYQHPEKGFLGGRTLIGSSGPTLIQYWRSFEDLEAFARNPGDPHKAAWKMFYQLVGTKGAVGIWHETYQITPGQFENIYVNMPRFGLGEVLDHAPTAAKRPSARERLQGQEAVGQVSR